LLGYKVKKMKRISLVLFALMLFTTWQCAKKGPMLPLTKKWEKVVPQQEVPAGLPSLKAADCGICHPSHYEEWKLSTHAHAWSDLQFQAELKKESSPFMCINCHIPLQNQQEYIVKGLIDGDIYQPVREKNPLFDPELQKEGITCAACHVRDNVIIGPTGGNGNLPHPVVKDTVHLSSENLCINCHNAVAVLTPELACTFETGDEWKAGPFADEKDCKSCHMEPITREIMPGFGEKLTHRHYFTGSGIPKFDTVQTTVLNGLAFYPSEVLETYQAGEPLNYNFRAKNEHAGHRVPTGDPERFILFHFTLFDVAGDTLKHLTERIGEEWEWYPEAKKLTDNNLDPGEEVNYRFTPVLQDTGQYRMLVRVEKHRLNKANAEYNKLGDHYPLYIEILNREYTFKVSAEETAGGANP